MQLVHHIDSDQPSDRKWYTIGAALVPPYLLCLLKGTALFTEHGVEKFPHYSPDPLKDFTAVLDRGEVFRAPELRPAAARKPVMAIDDGDDDDAGDADDVNEREVQRSARITCCLVHGGGGIHIVFVLLRLHYHHYRCAKHSYLILKSVIFMGRANMLPETFNT